MSKLVVDTSVAVKWLVNEPNSDKARALVVSQIELIAPDLMPIEVASALRGKVLEKPSPKLTIEEAKARLAKLADIEVRIVASAPYQAEALNIALLAPGRSVYDSLYLALAVAEGCKLITADEAFLAALKGSEYEAYAVWLGAWGKVTTPSP